MADSIPIPLDGGRDRDRHSSRGGGGGGYRDDRDNHRPRYDDRERGDRDRYRDRDRGGYDRDRRDDRERDPRRDRRDDRPPRRDDGPPRGRYEDGRDRGRERGGPPPPRGAVDRDEFNPPPPGERRGRRPKDTTGSPDRRSPTPENMVPISQRKRRATGWDVHAPGYEQYTALQAKMTGLFNLPGANRTQIQPIMGIQGLPTPQPVPGLGMGIGNNPNLQRQSRRLYIGSITPEINEQNLTDLFNTKMAEMNVGTGGPGNPVLAVQCNYEKSYAFVEFRSAEDATAAMAFDGIMFINGPLKIRRPKDYGGIDMSGGSSIVHVPGVVSTNVPDSINKIFVGGLPSYLNEEQVQELLKSFGELKAFHLVRENGTGPSKGYAFFEYVDASITDTACQGLNGMELGDKYLVVQRASIGAKAEGMMPPGSSGDMLPFDLDNIPKPIMPASEQLATQATARILLMLNMVTTDDLVDDTEYGELLEDIKEECGNYGPIEDLRIPRPVKKDKSAGATAAQEAQRADEAAGVGRVYVKYSDPDSANKALNALAGRSFGGRSIIATLLTENSQTTPPLAIIFGSGIPPPPP